MTTYISELEVSLNEDEKRHLLLQGFTVIEVDLNKGTAGKPIYIWYKCGSEPITRVQFSFTEEMGDGLKRAGFTKVPKNLNTGAGGDVIYLWYFKGTGEFHTPIVEIDVTTDAVSEAIKFARNWERLNCDLNRRAKGNWIHAWVKREKQTFICDVALTDEDLFREGYIRLDEDCIRGRGTDCWFFWYRQTTDPERALSDLQISSSDAECQALQQQNYQAVSVNLDNSTGSNLLRLWCNKDGDRDRITAVLLLLNTAAVEVFEKAGVHVITGNLNEDTKGCVVYICIKKWEPSSCEQS